MFKNQSIIFIASFFLITAFEGDRDQRNLKICSIQSNKSSSWRSVVVSWISGRLGNHMYGYMYNLALQLNYGLETPIFRKTAIILKQYFTGISLPIVEDTYCNFEPFYDDHLARIEFFFNRYSISNRIPVADIIDNHQFIIEETTTSLNRKPSYFYLGRQCMYHWEMYRGPLELFQHQEWAFNRAIFLHPGHEIKPINESAFFRNKGLEEKLLNGFKFKPDFINSVDQVIQKVKLQHQKKLKKMPKGLSECIYIGMHCRRTDHGAWMKQQGNPEVTASYYIEAMDLFRQNFKHNVVIFLLVSDDLEWARSNLIPRVKQKDLYIVGRDLVDSVLDVGFDLALLSRCNHTILSHGTFSFFGAFLAGGIKIIPEHFTRFRKNHLKKHLKLLSDPFKQPLQRIHLHSEWEIT